MDSRTMNSVIERLNRLERESARVRLGTVSNLSPLRIKLGGSTSEHEGVSVVGDSSGFAVDDIVVCLKRGNDLIVLGVRE